MSHAVNDKISLEIATTVANQLHQHPEWIVMARDNLARWMVLNKDSPAMLRNNREWLAILDRPLQEIVALLTSTSDDSQRLRSNSPFVGALTPAQVLEIKRRIRHDQTAA